MGRHGEIVVPRGSRAVLPGLIVASTALFVLGIAMERSTADQHEDEHAEGDEGESRSKTRERPEGNAEAESEVRGEEQLFGVDLESTPVVALAVVGSLGLAAASWLRPTRSVLSVVAATMFGFAALDTREVVHQAEEGHGTNAAVATVVSLLHLGAGITASRGILRSRSDRPGTPSG